MKKHLIAIIIITLFSFTLAGKLFYPSLHLIATPEFVLNDAIQLSYASKHWYWEKLHTQELPFWSTQMGAGFPVLGEGQTGVFFLPNLLLYGLLPSAPLAYNISLVLVLIITAMGTYFWLSLFSVPWTIMLLGGLTFGSGGFFLFHLQHITLLQSFSLLPFLFVATHQVMKKQRLIDILFFSIVFSQQIFAGFMQAVLITAIGTTIYAVFIYTQSQNNNKRGLLILFMSYLLGLLLSAPQIIPSIEFLKAIPNNSANNPEYATMFSFPLRSFLSFLSPFMIGNPKNATYYTNVRDPGLLFWETNGFVGIFPLLLTGLVLFLKKSRKKAIPFLTILGIAVLLMLGKYSPLYFIFDFFPLSLFRVPARFVVLVSYMLVTIGTLTLSDGSLRKQRWVGRVVVLFWIVNLMTIIPYWYSYHEYKTPSEVMEKPIATDAVPPNGIVYRHGTIWQHNKIYLESGWIYPDRFTIFQNALRPNTNTFWGITTFDAYSSRILRRKYIAEAFIQTELYYPTEATATISADMQKFFSLAGISTIISEKIIDSDNRYSLLKTITDSDSTLYVYQNPTSNTRVYIADVDIPVTTVSDIQNTLGKPSFNPNSSVLIETTNPLHGHSNEILPSSLITTKWSDLDIRIKTTTQKDTTLVLQNTYYPGWVATIDNNPTTIYPANITSMAITLPKGEHTVRFYYQPKSFLLGCSFMLLGIMIACTVILLRKRSAFLRKMFPV